MEAMVGNVSYPCPSLLYHGAVHDGSSEVHHGNWEVHDGNSEVHTVPSIGRLSPSAADDSGIYVIYGDESGKPEVTEDMEAPSSPPERCMNPNSLSPLVLLVPGATPLAVVARDDHRTPPASPQPQHGVIPPRLVYAEQEATLPAYPSGLYTVDEGFEFYQREIIEFKLSREMAYYPKDFLERQPEITAGMRSLLIDWLTRITHRCRLKQDTLFLAANIVDRFLAVTALSSDCLQLLGIVALFIAGKQEENCPLEISQILQLSEESFTEEKYSRKQALLLESLVLSSLKFDLHPPTPLFFMETLATHRITGCRLDTAMMDCIEARRRLARYTLELGLQDYTLSRFRPSVIAASVMTSAEETLDDGYFLFRPGPPALMDLDFRSCLHETRLMLDNVVKNNQSLDEIINFYAIKA